MKSTTYTIGLVALMVGLAVVGVGGFGMIQGMPTRTIEPFFALCLGAGSVSFVAGLFLLMAGHADELPRFCNRCGEIAGATDETCGTCGHVLA